MRLFLGVVLLVFSAYTAWVAWQFGYTSVFTVCFSAHPSAQALLDLFIAAGMLTFIMIVDNHRSGRSFLSLLPYLILALVFASIGPLLYFLIHPELLTFKRSS